MGEKRQSATYFTFKGGLNTESSQVNAPAEDASEMINVKLAENGSVVHRKGIDFLPNLDSDTSYTDCPTDLSVSEGVFHQPAPSSISFRVIKDDGSSFRVWIIQVGKQLYIYDQDSLATLRDMDNYRQRIKIPDLFSEGLAHHKTAFIKDHQRVYLLNPALPLMFIRYIEDGDYFTLKSAEIYYRDLPTQNKDDKVVNDSKVYRCIKTHVASETTEPGEGNRWRNYWVHEGDEPPADAPDAWSQGTIGEAVVHVVEELIEVKDGKFVENRTFYECLAPHTSSSTNEPGIGENWKSYWRKWANDTSDVDFIDISGGAYRSESGELVPTNAWVSGKSYKLASSKTYRSNVIRLTDSEVEVASPAIKAGVMASGRLWLANPTGSPNEVYFSQSIIQKRNYERFYQWADPNDEDDPDLVASDGGKIIITTAEEINALADFRGGVLVLASNGVWYIAGQEGAFAADNYSVTKISDVGCLNPHAWTYVEDFVVYAGLSGIYAVSLDSISALPTVSEISQKVKSFWTGIRRTLRDACQLSYNGDSYQLIIGMYFEQPAWWASQNSLNSVGKFRDMLIFDTKLKAWYKYRMAEDDTGYNVTPSGITDLVANLEGLETVTVGIDTAVTAGGEEVFVAESTSTKQTITGMIGIKRRYDDASNKVELTLLRLEGDGLYDFSQVSNDMESYESYFQSVPQIYSDIGHRKQAPYLHTVFERVEDGFDETTQEYTNPGSCFYRIIWDWATDDTAGPKWGTAYQAYKPNKYNLTYDDGTIIGRSVVQNKHRIRGSGRAISFRFESEVGKDFHLLGWQTDLFASERV